MPFLMIRNDITKVHVDAIVNTANRYLKEGSGTSRAIYLAAGEEELTKACEKIGYCELGKAVITDGFGLPAKYVIHTVGPRWEGGNRGENVLLYSAYREALKLAREYELESIAFPLISSGNYGFPKEQALKIAVSAISDFLLEYEMMVYLVLYDRKSLAVSQKLFVSVQEYIDDHYVEDKDESYRGNRRNQSRGFWERFRREEEEREPSGHGEYAETSTPWTAQQPFEIHETQNAYAAQPFLRDEEQAAPPPAMAPQKSVEKKKGRRLEDLMKQMGETFSQMLLRLIDERNLTDAQVYHKANIDRRHFSKIRNNIDYAPNKKTVMAFAVALELSLDEAEDLLRAAGFSFANNSKFDIIIRFFLESGQYNVFEINEMLFAYGQPLLGE